MDDRGYENLLASRVALQRFLRWSQEQAAVAGLTTAQHQLLLVLRIHPDPPSRPSANWRPTCSSASTARSSWPTGWKRSASSAGTATTTAGGWCGCS